MLPRFESWLRWLPMLLACWIAGQFLEGPPYREIVRSGAFILLVCSVSLAAATALWRKGRYPLLPCVVSALMTTGGFVWLLQHYYDGGKNPAYRDPLAIFSLLFAIQAVIYLRSLNLPWRPWGTLLHPDRGRRSPMVAYRLSLYAKKPDGSRGGICKQAEGGLPLPETLILSGYAQDQVIELTPYWEQIRLGQLTIFTTEVSVYETIIKFGEAMQLVDHYELELHVTYAASHSSPLN